MDRYVDSNHAGAKEKRRSILFFFFTLNGCCITWKSQLQSIIALSSTNAECIASIEEICLQGVLKELSVYSEVEKIFGDNLSALNLCKNLVFYDRKKHVDVRYHFIHEKVTYGLVKLAR